MTFHCSSDKIQTFMTKKSYLDDIPKFNYVFISKLEILKILEWVINFKVPLIFTWGARVLENSYLTQG